MQRAQGWAEQGGWVVFTAGRASSTLVQGSCPGAIVSVFFTGTATLAPIFSDNQPVPTPLGNPFTSDIHGHWFFYAPNGRYDVMISGACVAQPWTMGDVLLFDPEDD
jgi:hypothetical protein